MQAFSIRDLRERSGELSREVEQGNLSVVTKHGNPLFVTVPFSQELLSHGIHVILAVKLFAEGNISIGKAAKVAKMGIAEFTEHLSEQGIPIVDFTEEEFDQEMAYLNS